MASATTKAPNSVTPLVNSTVRQMETNPETNSPMETQTVKQSVSRTEKQTEQRKVQVLTSTPLRATDSMAATTQSAPTPTAMKTVKEQRPTTATPRKTLTKTLTKTVTDSRTRTVTLTLTAT